jgi:UDP-N-acetylmuramoylalanine--D-glutamate ligase
MTPCTTFKGRRAAVFGLGGSGIATAKALVAGGCDVLCWDDNQASRERAAAAELPVVDLAAADWSDIAALVLSPGVPLTHPKPHWSVERARASGVEVIGDVELFCRERMLAAPNAPFVAVTGTNGKSTTTALIGHIFEKAGFDVQLGGNIGRAVLLLDPPANGRFHVLELSSFQIDLAPSLQPTVAVMLNITPDHLERHGTLEQYAAIKERIVASAETAIVGVDDALSRAMAERRLAAGHPTVQISAATELMAGIFADGSVITLARTGRELPIADIAGIPSLRGRHNGQNAAAAIAAVSTLGVNAETIRTALPSFPGLPHRMEEVGRRGRVLFINDSKATNADSAEKALSSFSRIYWILGGKPKEGGIVSLAPWFDRIAKAYLIGEASEAFAATLGKAVRHRAMGTLAKALEAAAADAAKDDAAEPVVLLSPACASYDQFKNFEARGDAFRALVRALPGVEMNEQGAMP